MLTSVTVGSTTGVTVGTTVDAFVMEPQNILLSVRPGASAHTYGTHSTSVSRNTLWSLFTPIRYCTLGNPIDSNFFLD
jgi:hypothetical protein